MITIIREKNTPAVDNFIYKVVESPEKEEVMSDNYVVIGRTLKGSRFFSPILTREEVYDAYKKFIAMITYFGGGVIEIVEIFNDDYNVVYIEEI